MIKTIIGVCCLLIILFTGCVKSGGDSDIVDWADPGMEFAIVSPGNDSVVTQRWNLEIQGVGMRIDAGIALFDCSVHTDRWYTQGNRYKVSDNGSWRTWVDLGGTGEYNNHTIRVQVTYSDGSVDTTEVTGVVVQE